MAYQHDPDGFRLPIKIDSTSSDEFEPIPLAAHNEIGNEQALIDADEASKKLGTSRRCFLVSASGVASTLLAFNTVNAAAGFRGGFFDLPNDAAFENDLANSRVEGDEFIFDVHGHFINPKGAWLDKVPEGARPFANFPATKRGPADSEGLAYLDYLSGDQFIQDVFVDSDTDMMVLSFVPSTPDAEPLTIEEATGVQNVVNKMQGSKRMLVHGRVNPNQDGDLDRMDELAETYKVAAWKTYTQWGPDGEGFYLTDEKVGLPFLEKARKLGIKNIAVHKGIPFGPNSYEHSKSTEIGAVAKMYPDLNFMIYHSSFVPGQKEEAFVPGGGRDGIDTLIQSLIDNGIEPNSNVYADLGSTWRFLMRDPNSAAHAIGKLLKYVGEDSVIWGTDSIWYGSPQDQIQAFRTFQISREFREEFGYPELTSEIRAKTFGLNAAKPYGIKVPERATALTQDKYALAREENRNDPNPHFLTYGPKTRRSFLSIKKT